MSPLRLRALLKRGRRHAALVVLVVAVGCAVAAHHGGAVMDDGHGSMDMGAVAQMCLAAFTAIGAAVAAVSVGLLALGRRRTAALLSAPGIPWTPRLERARARAGPALLCLLCVSRR